MTHASASAASRPSEELGDPAHCPFRGLTPYTAADADFFFGRDGDRDLVIANLMASRLTVLYGPSGVGKSSLLQAGVIRRLGEVSSDAFSYLATGHALPVYHASWTHDPLTAIAAELATAVARERPELAELVPPGGRLSAELLREVSDRLDTDVFLLLDQFEELSLYQTGPQTEALAAELGRIVSAPGLRAGVLIGIREDAFATLDGDRFKRHVPGMLDNSLRLDHLGREAAREAIERPLQRWNERYADPAGDGPGRPMSVEPALVDELLDQLRTGNVAVADTGRGGSDDSAVTIETPFLQLVMTRLWSAERADGSDTLRLATLTRLGGAQGIVRRHLDDVMATLSEPQQEIAAQIMRYLVTPSGSKIANSAEALAYFAELPDVGAVAEVLEELSGGSERILRPVPAPQQPGPPLYEVFHDVLASAVLEWRRRYVEARDRAAEQAALAAEQSALVQAKEEAEAQTRRARRELRRTRLIAASLVGLMLAVAVLGVLGKREQDRAQLQEHLAESRYQLGVDPAAALHSALQAYREDDTPAAATAVRNAFAADLSDRVFRGHQGVVHDAVYSPDGRRIASYADDRTVRIVDAVDGRLLGVVPPEAGDLSSPIMAIQYSLSGEFLAIATQRGRVRLVDGGTGALRRVLGDEYHGWVSLVWRQLDRRDVLLVSLRGAVYGETKDERQGTRDEPARLYDAESGRAVHAFGAPSGAAPAPGGYWADLSSDASRVVAVGSDDRVRVWNTRTETLLATSEVLEDWVQNLVFVTPGADRVALLRRTSGRGMFNIAFWTWAKGSAKDALDQEDWNTTAFSAPVESPDHRYVAAGMDKDALVFETDTGDWWRIPEAPDWVNSVSFSADGQLLVTAGADGTARVWAFRAGRNRPLAQLVGHRAGVASAWFHPTDPRTVVTAGADGTVRTWHLPRRTDFYKPHTWWTIQAELDPAESYVATTRRLGSVDVWATATGQSVASVEVPTWHGFVQRAFLTPDGKTIVAQTDDDYAPVVADWRNDKEVKVLQRGDYPVTDVAVSPDGSHVAAGTIDNRVTVWNLASRTIEKSYAKPGSLDGESVVVSVRYLPSGELAAASTDGSIRIWGPSDTGSPRLEFTAPGRAWFLHLAATADGKSLTAITTDRVLYVWSLAAPDTPPRTFPGPEVTSGSPAFSPDGSLLAVGASDAAVHVYDWRAGQEIGVMHRHADSVNSVRFLKDGRILSASDDGTAAIYDCVVCRPIQDLVREAEARDRRYEAR